MAGKEASSQNAVRHGLSAAKSQAENDAADAIAATLVGSGASVLRRSFARAAAEATLELRAVQQVRRDIISGWIEKVRAAGWANSDDDAKAMAIAEAAAELLALDRYERRALSRRKNAIRRLEATPYPRLLQLQSESCIQRAKYN
jgi:hypothetical protein